MFSVLNHKLDYKYVNVKGKVIPVLNDATNEAICERRGVAPPFLMFPLDGSGSFMSLSLSP
jgi:hypothetical protein